MKTLLLPLLFLITLTSYSQTLTNITPNQGAVGTTLTATITGQNTFFQTGSPQGANSIYIGPFSQCPHISGTNISIIDDDHISVDFTIPANWANGVYDISMVRNNTTHISLPASFTVTGGLNYSIQSVSPNTTTENSFITATITGQNLQTLFNTPPFYIIYYIPGTSFYGTATNVTVVNTNTLTADFQFPLYCDTGNVSLKISSPLGCFDLPNAIHVQGFYPKQLVSISPAQGNAGNTLNALVTGQNVFFQTGSPQGLQSIKLMDSHCHIINGTNLNVIDDDHFSADFNLPANAINGVYDVNVMMAGNHNHVLPAAFTIQNGIDRGINTFTPSTANAGTTISVTITGNNLDSLCAVVSLALYGSGGFKLNATNIVASSTQATMDFQIPIYADNGFYEFRSISSLGCYKFPQALQVSGGLPRTLVSMTPNQGMRGQTLSAIVTGQYTFFMAGTIGGGVRRVHFNHVNNNYHFQLVQPAFSVLNDDSIACNFTVPFAAPQGFYNVSVEMLNGIFYHLNPGFEVTGTRIQGNVYLDVDSNGIYNTWDVKLPNKRVMLLPDSSISITDVNGEFNFGVDSGQYTIEMYPDTNWIVTSVPSSIPISVDSTDTLGIKILLNPIIETYDVYVSLNPGFPRCYSTSSVTLTYVNFSTTYVNGLIYYVMDTNLTLYSSYPLPDSTNGDTLFWNFDSLGVLQSKNITMYVNIPVPAFTQLTSTAYIEANDGNGLIYHSYTTTLNQTVLCSYDPNDKSVNPPGVQAGHYTLRNEYLEYLVRFQNTGSDTAFEVMVLDTLDPLLDPATFQLIGSSHIVETHLNGHALEFRFNNILLPDSNIDEPGSHGFITFRVKPYPNINSYSQINNGARIYFDLNSPVVTNSVFNTIVDQIPNSISTLPSVSNNLIIYPNPSSEKVNILLSNSDNELVDVRIYDVNGRIVKHETTKGSMLTVDVSGWNKGVYLILVDTKEGVRRNARIVVQ